MPVDQGFLCCFIEEADIELCFRVQDESCSAVAVREPEHGYFLLKYLKQQQKSAELLYDGVVVDTSMTEVTFYVDFLCSFRHCRRPNFDVTPGQKVIVKVNQIDLFDGIIRFDLRQP